MNGNFDSMESFQPPPEIKVETPKTPEIPSATPEHNQETFSQLTEQAQETVDLGQKKIFDEADGRIEKAATSINLDQEKASRVFNFGGFSERISQIKDRITNLGVQTKAKIQSMLGQEPTPQEQQTKPAEVSPNFEVAKSEPKPMTSEKGFDADVMVKRSNLFSGVPREDKSARIEEFKERLGGQREGLVEVQDDIVKLVQENPDLSIEDIKKAIEPKLQEALVNPDQREALDKILGEYSKAHQTVRHYRTMYPDNNQLFEFVFGFKPTGQFEVVEGPVTLGFRCRSQEDFARVINCGLTPSEDSKLNISEVGGMTFPDPPNGTSWDLAHRVIVVSDQAETGNSAVEDYMAHEEQHAINNLFKYAGTRPKFYHWENMQDIATLSPEMQKDKVVNYLRTNRESIDNNRLHDEILAQYRGLTIRDEQDMQTTVGMLNGPYREHFYGDRVPNLERELNKMGVNTEVTKAAIKQVFEDELPNTTRDALNSLRELEQNGFSKDEAINLLQNETLVKWPKTVKRMTEFRKK